jgi:hypothetical protein
MEQSMKTKMLRLATLLSAVATAVLAGGASLRGF